MGLVLTIWCDNKEDNQHLITNEGVFIEDIAPTYNKLTLIYLGFERFVPQRLFFTFILSLLWRFVESVEAFSYKRNDEEFPYDGQVNPYGLIVHALIIGIPIMWTIITIKRRPEWVTKYHEDVYHPMRIVSLITLFFIYNVFYWPILIRDLGLIRNDSCNCFWTGIEISMFSAIPYGLLNYYYVFLDCKDRHDERRERGQRLQEEDA